MAKGNKWSYVYYDNRIKLEKYFGRTLDTDIYIRLYTIKSRNLRFLQISGHVTGFSSRFVDNATVEQILADFPFIKEFVRE